MLIAHALTENGSISKSRAVPEYGPGKDSSCGEDVQTKKRASQNG